MPFGTNNTYKTSETDGNNSVSKVLAIFNRSFDVSNIGRQNKATVVFQSPVAFESRLSMMPSGMYGTIAGSDLSNIFYPYIARSSGVLDTADVNKLPNFGNVAPSSSFNSPVNLYSLTPFWFQNTDQSGLYNLYTMVSGDAYKGAVSHNRYVGSPDQYRNLGDQRSIGFRLPMMAVGYGYTTWGDPFPAFPSGSVSGTGHNAIYYFGTTGASGERINVEEGWKVDPQDYIAAPIDLRYDVINKVWTAPKGFWAEVSSQGSGLYSWREVVYGNNGAVSYTARSGGTDLCPAIEANHDSDASGILYLYPKERKHYHMFVKGGGGTSSTPSAGQYQYQVYQMTSNNAVGWDYVRAHP